MIRVMVKSGGARPDADLSRRGALLRRPPAKCAGSDDDRDPRGKVAHESLRCSQSVQAVGRTRIRFSMAVALAMLLSTTALAEVDYSKCAEFFGNFKAKEGNEKGWRIEKGSPFVPRRLRYVPFDISPDGDLVLHDGGDVEKSLERDNTGNVIKETVTHHSSTLETLETLDPAKLSMPTQKVSVVVERNREGHITAITENVGLVTDEDSEIARMGDRNKDEELGFAYLGTRTEFDIRAGECVPMKRSILIAYKRDGERLEGEIAVFDTQLCRAIEDFIVENEHFSGVFLRHKNDQMAELLESHAPDLFLSGGDSARRFLPNDKIDELLNKHYSSKSPVRSLELQVLAGYMSATQMHPLRQQWHGANAIIFGQMTLAECFYFGLRTFIGNPSFWREE